MNPLVFVFAVLFVGLMTLVSALGLSRRESGGLVNWWGSRRGLGTLCLLAAGVGSVLNCVYRLAHWDPSKADILFSQPSRFALWLGGSLGLLLVGLWLRATGGRVDGIRIVWWKGTLALSTVAALFLTLAGLVAFQMVGTTIGDQSIISEIAGVERTIKTTPPGQTTYAKRYEFSKDRDWFSRVRPIWEIALAEYRGKPNVRYLEIGLFEGRSAFWTLENILTHPTADLTGIDPFIVSKEPSSKAVRTYKDVFYSNLALSGLGRKVKVIEGFSQIELRKLPLESFDLIYIDGSHSSNDVLEDAILSWRLLKDGGLMILDDYQLHPGLTRAVDTFYSFFAEDFQPILFGSQAILRKRPRDRSVPGEWR